MYKYLLLFVLINTQLKAQELFPMNEPASTVPKNVLGIRLAASTYEELDVNRNLGTLKLMYGVTPNLTLSASGSVSNHHAEYLPANLITHTHEGNQTIYQTNEFQRGLNYDYQFNGVYFNAKYRFLNKDAEKEHFRIAAYGEGSYIKSAHDEAEPTLMDDTKGLGAGIIATYLKKHFASSLTAGLIIPGDYKETTPDFSGGDLHTKITYGRAVVYNLSFGYLLYPVKYKDYSQVNVNAYVEFMGKSYEAADITQNDFNVSPQTDLLKAGSYVDIYPSLQVIFNSNLRVDLSAGFPLIGKSYVRFYPVFQIGIQRYFFL